MRRSFLPGLLAAGLVAVSFNTADAQDAKKEKPKQPPRIAVSDPKQLADQIDFPIQGEFEGTVKAGTGEVKLGIQIVAQGDGKFLAKAYHGGLPGAGWDGKVPIQGHAIRETDGVTLQDEKGTAIGKVTNDSIVISNDRSSGTLKKVTRLSPTIGAKPPAGAVVLFAEPGDEANWTGGKLVELSDGKFLNMGIKSKQAFGAFKAHVEFRLPWMPNSRGQGRANSGVYVQDRYEIQVLDSFGLSGENNECGGIYQAYKPLVNMCLPPMAWQTYDIEFTPAAFGADGKKTANARLTLVHNGVKVHDNVELKGPSGGGRPETATPGPIQFQNHGDPLVYRNVWVVETK